MNLDSVLFVTVAAYIALNVAGAFICAKAERWFLATLNILGALAGSAFLLILGGGR